MFFKFLLIVGLVLLLPLCVSTKYCGLGETACGEECCTGNQWCGLKSNRSQDGTSRHGCFETCKGEEFGCPPGHTCCTDNGNYCCNQGTYCLLGGCTQSREFWDLIKRYTNSGKDKTTKPTTRQTKTQALDVNSGGSSSSNPGDQLDYSDDGYTDDYSQGSSSSSHHYVYIAGGGFGGTGFIFCCYIVRWRSRRRAVLIRMPQNTNRGCNGRANMTGGGPGRPGRHVPSAHLHRALGITPALNPDPEAQIGRQAMDAEPPPYTDTPEGDKPETPDAPPSYADAVAQGGNSEQAPPYSEFRVDSDRKQLCDEAE